MKQAPLLFIQRIKSLIILVLVVMIFGCGLTPVIHAPPLKKGETASESQGYVVAKIINAGNFPLPFNALSISPINLNESKEIKFTELSAIGIATGQSSLFASAVDAGTYSLLRISSRPINNADAFYYKNVEGDLRLGTFDVIAGEITDLGTLIYYPQVQGDRHIEGILRPPASRQNKAIIESVLPFFDYDTANLHSWHEDEQDDQRRAAYNSAVQNPVTYNTRLSGPDGSLYFLSQLGTLLVRSNTGEWTIDAVDTDLEITAVDQNIRGDIALGGEYGSLFLKRKDQRWEALEIDPAYSIQDVRFHKDRYLDVILKGLFDFKVLRKNIDSENRDWKTMASYAAKLGWLDSEGKPFRVGVSEASTDPTPRLMSYAYTSERAGNHLLFMATERGKRYSPFTVKRHRHYRFNPATWNISASEGLEKGIDRIINAGAVELGIKYASAWSLSGRDSYLRYNLPEKKWIKINTQVTRCLHGEDVLGIGCIGKASGRPHAPFNFLSVPVFFSESEALAFVRLFKVKNKEKAVQIVESQDGGISWSLSEKRPPNKYCWGTVPEAKDVLLVSCEGTSSDFYESSDRGKSWRHVREHESF